jgi:hypothetical protein
MTIRLTIHDRFQTPLLINPDHVVDVLPRKQLTPVDAQQSPSVHFTYLGSAVSMVTHKTHNVMESFEVVQQLLNPPPPPTMVVTGTTSETVVLPETTVVPPTSINQPPKLKKVPDPKADEKVPAAEE